MSDEKPVVDQTHVGDVPHVYGCMHRAVDALRRANDQLEATEHTPTSWHYVAQQLDYAGAQIAAAAAVAIANSNSLEPDLHVMPMPEVSDPASR